MRCKLVSDLSSADQMAIIICKHYQYSIQGQLLVLPDNNNAYGQSKWKQKPILYVCIANGMGAWVYWLHREYAHHEYALHVIKVPSPTHSTEMGEGVDTYVLCSYRLC